MCGLVGVISKRSNGFSKDQQDVFGTLLFVDMLRGEDSTGLFVVANDGDVYGAKDDGNSLFFMGSKEYDEAQRRAWNRGAAMIGHNRKATRGAVNDKNAHPFVVNNELVLVHNGTMYSDHKKFADVEVDSHAIAHLLHEKPVAEALSSFNAAYALIWWDVRANELCMIRNDQRPLFWMEVADAWVWASEKEMLDFAVGRMNKERETMKVLVQPTQLPADTLQKFTLKNKGWEVSSEKLDIKKPVTQQSQSSGNGRSDAGNWDGWDGYEWEGGGGHGHWERAWNNNHPQPPFRRQQQHPMHSPRGDNMGASGNNAVVQLLPAPKKSTVRQPTAGASLVNLREPQEWAGISDMERTLAIKNNKTVTYGEYREILLNTYAFNTQVHCAPFDYGYVNLRDGSDGYYLYASPFDDEDVILRQFFGPNVTEERMIQLASADYVFEYTLANRQWALVDPKEAMAGTVMNDTLGFCIIKSSSCKMISTGLDRAENEHVH